MNYSTVIANLVQYMNRRIVKAAKKSIKEKPGMIIKTEGTDFISTLFSQVAYDVRRKQMFLNFPSGYIYVYENVPQKIFTGLLNSKSLGRFYASEIRDNFEARRLG